MMYDELVKSLRDCAEVNSLSLYKRGLMKQAADAIEELVRKEKFSAFLWNTIQPNEMETYLSMYNAGDEKEES